MEYIKETVLAHYKASSDDDKQIAAMTFKSLDRNEDGKIAVSDVINYFKNRENEVRPSFLKALGKSEDGISSTLDFEEASVFYYLVSTKCLAVKPVELSSKDSTLLAANASKLTKARTTSAVPASPEKPKRTTKTVPLAPITTPPSLSSTPICCYNLSQMLLPPTPCRPTSGRMGLPVISSTSWGAEGEATVKCSCSIL